MKTCWDDSDEDDYSCSDFASCSTQCGTNSIAGYGDHILNGGTTCTLSAPIIITESDKLSITKSGTGDAILSGGGTTHLFESKGDLTLTNLIVQEGAGRNGKPGAILATAGNSNYPTLIFDGMTFKNNHAPDGEGGAFFGDSIQLTIKDSSFHGNTAIAGKGGAISVDNSMFVLQGTVEFKNNRVSFYFYFYFYFFIRCEYLKNI
jgi:hypothetical protein